MDSASRARREKKTDLDAAVDFFAMPYEEFYFAIRVFKAESIVPKPYPIIRFVTFQLLAINFPNTLGANQSLIDPDKFFLNIKRRGF